ncbi:MAG: hypothetical protein ACHQT7_01255 [Candidatus Levyibacteriota bacterium]
MIESFILGLGFYGTYMLSGHIQIQALLMLFIVSMYMVMGIVHHALMHDIHGKIVLEYIIIGSLVFSIFLFLKSGVV